MSSRGALRRAARAAQHPCRRTGPRLEHRRVHDRSVTSETFTRGAVSTTAFGADVRGTVRDRRSGASSGDVRGRLGGGVPDEPHRPGRAAPVSGRGCRPHGDALRRSGRADPVPWAISPHQPVFDIAAFAWADDGVEVAGSPSPATCSRWKTSATGRMPGSRRTAVRSHWRSRTCCPPAARCGKRRPPRAPVAADDITEGGAGTDAATRRGSARRRAEVGCRDRPDRRCRPGRRSPRSASGPPPRRTQRPSRRRSATSSLVELDLSSPNWRAALSRAAAGGMPLAVHFLLDANHPLPLVDGGDRASRPAACFGVAAFTRGRRAACSDREAVLALRVPAGRDGDRRRGGRGLALPLHGARPRAAPRSPMTSMVSPSRSRRSSTPAALSSSSSRLRSSASWRCSPSRSRQVTRCTSDPSRCTPVQRRGDRSTARSGARLSRRGVWRRVHRFP